MIQQTDTHQENTEEMIHSWILNLLAGDRKLYVLR